MGIVGIMLRNASNKTISLIAKGGGGKCLPSDSSRPVPVPVRGSSSPHFQSRGTSWNSSLDFGIQLGIGQSGLC